MQRRMSLKIFGRAQGLGFRAGVRNFAKRNNIVGWVRNEIDGSVVIEAEGEESDLQKFLNFCYNGIKGAEVESIDVDWSDITGEFKDFVIK